MNILYKYFFRILLKIIKIKRNFKIIMNYKKYYKNMAN